MIPFFSLILNIILGQGYYTFYDQSLYYDNQSLILPLELFKNSTLIKIDSQSFKTQEQYCGNEICVDLQNFESGYKILTTYSNLTETMIGNNLAPSLFYDIMYSFSYHPLIQSVILSPLNTQHTYFAIQIYGRGFSTEIMVIILDSIANITYQDFNYIEAVISIPQIQSVNKSFYLGGQGLKKTVRYYSSYNDPMSFGQIGPNISIEKQYINSTEQVDSFLIFPHISEGQAYNYTQNYLGALIVPKTGNYTFWLQADDYAWVYIASNQTQYNIQTYWNVPNIKYNLFDKNVNKSTFWLIEGVVYDFNILFVQNLFVGYFFLSLESPDGDLHHPAPNEIFFTKHQKPQVRLKGNKVWFRCEKCDYDNFTYQNIDHLYIQTKAQIENIYDEACSKLRYQNGSICNKCPETFDECIAISQCQRYCLKKQINSSQEQNESIVLDNSTIMINQTFNVSSFINENETLSVSQTNTNQSQNLSLDTNISIPQQNNSIQVSLSSVQSVPKETIVSSLQSEQAGCQLVLNLLKQQSLKCRDCKKNKQCFLCIKNFNSMCKSYPKSTQILEIHFNKELDKQLLDFSDKLTNTPYSYALSLMMKFNTPAYPSPTQGSLLNITISILFFWNVTEYYLKSEITSRSNVYYESLGISLTNPALSLGTYIIQILILQILINLLNLLQKPQYSSFLTQLSQTQIEAWMLFFYFSIFRLIFNLRSLHQFIQVTQFILIVLMFILQNLYIYKDLAFIFEKDLGKIHDGRYFIRDLNRRSRVSRAFRGISLLKKIVLIFMTASSIMSAQKLTQQFLVQTIFTIFMIILKPFDSKYQLFNVRFQQVLRSVLQIFLLNLCCCQLRGYYNVSGNYEIMHFILIICTLVYDIIISTLLQIHKIFDRKKQNYIRLEKDEIYFL